MEQAEKELIRAEHVTKIYGEKFKAVDDMDFRVCAGEIVGFVGQNGAGKTTTIKMMTGILDATEGRITICGRDIAKDPLEAKKSIGYIADNPDMFLRLTGLEFVNLMANIYGISQSERMERISELAEDFGVEQALTRPMSEYSHGMRQKMMVVAALVHHPPVWILDEPMTGLDPGAAFALKKRMRRHAKDGNCVFFSTHVLEVAQQLCDRILMVREGTLVYDGTLEQLTDRYPGRSLEEIFMMINERQT